MRASVGVRGFHASATVPHARSPCLPSTSCKTPPSARHLQLEGQRLIQASATQCPYRVLGLPPLTASEDDIRQAYRARARDAHPDSTGSADSAVLFLEIQTAYSLLMDPQKRAKYDARLRPGSKTVLSYLNARSAVRHGFNPSSSGSGVIDEDLRLELYSTMRDLLRQARRCMRQVEREVVKPHEQTRWSPVQAAASSGAQPTRSVHTPRTAPAAQVNSIASATSGSSRLVPMHQLHQADCLEGEPCEPWMYYAALEDRK